MKKQDVINLIKYHFNNNEDSFISESVQIARDFDQNGDHNLAQYIMELISDTNVYKPQMSYEHLLFLKKVEYSRNPLFLPDSIEEDIMGIARSANNNLGVSKFLFFGAPGTGKTEAAYQISRLLNRDILSVNTEELIDSRLGETAKNVVKLFDEINRLSQEKVTIIFDELDSLIMNRINHSDVREMGRVTSTFLKEFDSLNEDYLIIATTNLVDNFDKAVLRRFDATISFDRYSKEDLIEIADELLKRYIKKSVTSKQDLRLFNKILNGLNTIPYPGDLKQIIKTSIAFSNEDNEYDYLRKIYFALYGNQIDIKKLSDQGFTVREIEIISKTPKSTVSRKIRGLSNE